MIRIELPDRRSGGDLIRELLASVDAASLSLDPERGEVRIEEGAASSGAIAQRVERWLERLELDQARVHDGRGSFLVRRRRDELAPATRERAAARLDRYPPEPELTGA